MTNKTIFKFIKILSGFCSAGLTLLWALTVAANGANNSAAFAPTLICPDTVVTNGNDSGNGSLRQTIDDACDRATITFDNDYTIYLDSELMIDKDLTIDGETHAITISGDSGNDGSRDVRFLTVESDKVTIKNLVVVSGTASYGGAIYNGGEHLTIIDSTFSDNVATDKGGAIYTDFESGLTISNSTFSGNMASGSGSGADGGAIHNSDSSTVEIDQTVFSDNQASGNGGAVYNATGTDFTFSSSVVENNSADGLGGGMSLDGTAVISTSIFTNNSAAVGGGLYTYSDSQTTLDKSTLTYNTASGLGGAFYIADTFSLKNSTVFSNTADSKGGGIYIEASGNVTLTNTTFSHNEAPTAGGLYHDDSGALTLNNNIFANSVNGADCVNSNPIDININNLIEDGSCEEGTTTLTGFVSDDPVLAGLADYSGYSAGTTDNLQSIKTLALLSSSPAIDAGDSATCEAADQRGKSRPMGLVCDIGAYEADVYIVAVTLDGDGGTVTSDPSGIICDDSNGAVCTDIFYGDTILTLTATADEGYTFDGWSGDGCSGTGTCTDLIDAAKNVTATFTLNQHDLSVTVDGAGSGTVASSPTGIDCGSDCAESIDYGTAVTLTATADMDSTFTGWNGGGCSGTGTCVVVMTEDVAVTAVFSLSQQDEYSIYLPMIVNP